uniref:Uncharacterized protein n=1 Tax=Nelumbo nucifera TaxID=4432 RepID=A0A822YQN5_NELNU|nr:TPA_asm: hypothetical protein HUJ06_010379 [Nelumbo nucifera]
MEDMGYNLKLTTRRKLSEKLGRDKGREEKNGIRNLNMHIELVRTSDQTTAL